MNFISIDDLHWKSGFDYLLQSYRILKDNGLSYRAEIIGRGQLFNELNFSVDDLGLSDFVKISENINEVEVQSKLQNSDLVVFSNVSDSPNRTFFLQEALKRNIPIVRTQLNDSEDLNPNGNDVRVPVRAPDLLAEAILRLIPQMYN